MNPDFAEQERSLREQVEQSEQALGGLERKLQNVDAELGRLAEQQHQFEVLGQVCRSLEELENIGADHLFWAGQGGSGQSAEYVRDARRRVDAYNEEILRAEEQRMALAEKIGDHGHELDCLHYDLSEAIRREEDRKAEWLIERDPDDFPYHAQVMPWTRSCEEDRRYRKSLGTSMVTSFVLALLISSVAIPIADRPREIELPERVAKLVREELPPPPPAPEPEPIVEEEIAEPEPELAEEVPPKELPEANEKPQVAAAEEPDVKEQVKSKGILAFRDSFAKAASLRPAAQLGSQARVSSAGQDAVGRPTRNMVTTNAPGSSGGINLASISRDVGGGGSGMGGVEVTRVASSIGTGGNGFADRPLSGGALAGRTDEEIQIVFDRYKAALYRLYNRELRKDPTLRGQIVLKLTIEPDGSVSFCALQSTDMNAPMLSQQVVDRVSTFDFGAKEDIAAMTIIYPIDFLPAA